MRTTLVVLSVIVICVVGFGFYRGWFALSSPSPATGSNDVNVNLTTDTDKMKEDAETVKDKAGELTGNATERPEETDSNRPTDELPPKRVSADDGEPAATPDGN